MSERLAASSSRESDKPDVSDLASDLGQAALLLAAETVDPVSNGSVHQALATGRDLGLPSEVRDGIIPSRRTQFTRYNNPNTGKSLSDETKAKMSEAKRGKKLSPETRAKISEANKGKKRSPETRAKISEAKRGKKLSPEHRAKISEAQKGKKHTNETKAKLSAINQGKSLSDEHKAKISATQKSRHAASRAPATPLWQEMMTREEKLIALLPRLGRIERQIVVRSWGQDGHDPQSVDEITRQLFQGMPVWRAKVQGTIQAVQSLISGSTYPHQPLDNNRSQTSPGTVSQSD